mgnify:FL=1|jgi:type IV secretory pathway TraG/TraD family ATPase VirD4
MQHQLIFGTSVTTNPVPPVPQPVITFPGRTLAGPSGFQINEDIMARHILLLGGSGCGKTNTFCYTVDTLRRTMGEEDIAIIFDTKGEFFDGFAREGDYVIGNSARFRPISCTWNLFDEILADGWDETNISLNARELAAALFHDRGSSTQPFFCNAARDIFRAVLVHFIRQAKADPDQWRPRLNNADLLKALQSFQTQHYIQIFNHYADMRSLVSYLGDGKSNQALGVFGELNSMLSEYFVGILAAHAPDRSISMRNAVRRKGGRAIFVEYDLAVGETLTPIYRLLVDQALKEALSRTEKSGNVYFIADEFKLLPKLRHIDDALNFGRGLGVRVMAGIQSIDQLYDVYGKDKGAVIASGFGSIFAFHTNDGSSRDYITKRFGTNIIAYEYASEQKNSIVSREREGHTVEEWEQMELGLGQAVIGLGYDAPFLFQFDEYGRRG